MIIILDYRNRDKKKLTSFLEQRNCAYKYSLLEKDIIAASKIILPDPVNIDNAFRKLTLMNLTSVLRLVNSPLLGINNALLMMCKGHKNKSKFGMCFFDVNISSIGDYESDKISMKGELNIIKNSKLIKSNYNNVEISFDREMQPIKNILSTVSIKKDNEEYSLLYENQNYFGLAMDIGANEALFSHIIENFINLT